MTKEELFTQLLQEAKKQFGFEPDKVKELLKKHRYSGFRTEMYDIYFVCLRAEWYEMDEQEELRRTEKKSKELRGIWIPIPCPVCGAPTHGVVEWYGRKSKTSAWRCEKGGIRHFFWARANDIRARQGLPAIPWEKFNAVYDPNFTVPNTSIA